MKQIKHGLPCDILAKKRDLPASATSAACCAAYKILTQYFYVNIKDILITSAVACISILR